MIGGFADGAYDLAHEQRPLGGMDGAANDLVVLAFGIRGEAVDPRLMGSLLDERQQGGERLAAVADDLAVGAHEFAYLGGVDVEMNDLGLTGIGLEVARHAVVEAHADGDENIALIRHHVGTEVAVHAEHALVERMVGRQCGQT